MKAGIHMKKQLGDAKSNNGVPKVFESLVVWADIAWKVFEDMGRAAKKATMSKNLLVYCFTTDGRKWWKETIICPEIWFDSHVRHKQL
jgi:hypothetical protein